MSDLARAYGRFTEWYKEDVIPLWLNASYDTDKGGFFEALDYNGTPLTSLHRRVRVQSRQVYTWTNITRQGWNDAGELLAHRGFRDLIAIACPDDAERGCVHLLDDKNRIVDTKRDLYDQAFLLLACAARIQVGDHYADKIASNTMNFIERELASQYGGWLEDDQGTLPRRANPHMHLLEAFTAMYRATNEKRWRARAQHVTDLFLDHIFDEQTKTVREFFTERWEVAPGKQGAIVEPGHMMEWAWLLHLYGATIGENTLPQALIISKNAIKIGRKSNSLFLENSTSLQTPLVSGARRLWPQTEYIRTLSWLIENQAEKPRSAVALIDALFETYFQQPVSGLWCDEFDQHGRPIAKNVPASIFYHLYEAVKAVDHYNRKVKP